MSTDIDLEFVVGKTTYQKMDQHSEITNLANYITVDLLYKGSREKSMVIAIAEEIDAESSFTKIDGAVVDITTGAQRREFSQRSEKFTKDLNMAMVNATQVRVGEMDAINGLFAKGPNHIIGLETMFEFLLDLRMYEELEKAAQAVEDMLKPYVRFESDEPARTPKRNSADMTTPEQQKQYTQRYQNWGSW